MATITRDSNQAERKNVLDDLFARVFVLNWEVIAWTTILLVAIFTRFFMLGDRVMSHDESLHTVFSNNLFERGDYRHDPMMHGPVLFHFTALSYFLFGVSDFSARIYPAVLGVMIVMFPLLFRRWLGTKGAVLASIMLLISPLMMYYSRYIRHDMPSILSGMIMFYASMMYLSGPENQRRRAHWLYILAAAMLWNLGSKETAFIYIAIFGSFLTIYWLVRVAQYYFDIDGRMVFETVIMGFLLAGVASLFMIMVFSISLVELGTLDLRLEYLGDQFGMMVSGDTIEPAFSSFLSWTGLVTVAMTTIIIGPAIWAYRRRNERFEIPDALMLFGGMLVFIIFGVVLSPEYIEVIDGVEIRSSLAAVGIALGLILALSFWLIYAAIRIDGTRTFTNRLILLLGIMLVTTAILLIMEELSFEPSRSGQPEGQPVPGEEGVIAEDGLRLWPLLLAWFGGAGIIGFLLFAQVRGWWRLLDPFPEFDILIVMGSLILPWLTAFLIIGPFGVNGTPADYTAIAQDIGGFANVIPRDAPADIGKVVVGLLAFIPLATISIVAGLLWNWRRWLIAAIVFHALFAFFFTTVFTNIEGLASGMVYSLEYWLEQQGERRGSQPQYYYTLIILPFYEFLPIIGSFLAMIAGMVMFWRRSRNFEEYQAEKRAEANAYIDAVALHDQEDDPTPALNALDAETLADPNRIVDEKKKEEVETVAERPEVELVEPVGDRLLYVNTVDDRSPFRLNEVSFLLFVAWWGVLNLFGYTLAGEKMPWLGTHMTVPMILLSGWYFGRVFDRISEQKLGERGWLYLLLLPFLFVALFQIIAPFLGGQEPFQGTTSLEQQWTYRWIAVVALAGGLIYAVVRLTRFTGWSHLRQLTALVIFVMLAVFTFRSAWVSNFINYDEATEYLVYAHGGPGNKSVVERVEQWSLQTTDAKNIRILHDDRFSWPGSWYLRDFTNTLYIGSSTPSALEVDNADIIIVGGENRLNIEPLVADQFERYDHIRMWWPMQDYFDLSSDRINTLFELDSDKAGGTRRGIFDIWWARDYSTYASATRPTDPDRFNVDQGNWPVNNIMHLYVRKDIAAQVWPYGIGDGSVANVFTTVEENVCNTNYVARQPSLVFEREGLLQQPLGVEVGPDGRIYVSESAEVASRISVFEPDGTYIETIGMLGSADQVGAFFNRPFNVDFSPDGTMYVVDTWNYRVRMFDVAGDEPSMLTAWGQQYTAGDAAQRMPVDGFWLPRDIAVDANGNVYVSDTGNKRIRVYDSEGVFQRDMGSAGSGDGRLNEPAGIDVAAGRLFVADTWNRRLSIFNTDGTFVQTVPVSAWFEEQGNRPYLAADPARNLLYVTDPDAGRILVYTLDGECLGSFGQRTNQGAPSPGDFAVVGGIAVDEAGNLYVSDLSLGRVLKYEPFTVPMTTVDDVEAADEGESVERVPLDLGGGDAEMTAEIDPMAEDDPEMTAEVDAMSGSDEMEMETTAEVTVESAPSE